jgi:hypothetical protein
MDGGAASLTHEDGAVEKPVSRLAHLDERQLVEHIAISSAHAAHQLRAIAAGARRTVRLAWDPVNGPPHKSYRDGEPFQGLTIFNDGVVDCYVGQTNANLGASTALFTVKAGCWVTLPLVAAAVFVTGTAASSVLVATYDHAPAPAAGLIGADVGTVAPGSVDDGSAPVKVGGVYHLATPTLTDGQRGDVELDPRGNVRIVIADGSNANPTLGAAVSSIGSDAVSQGRAAVFAGAAAFVSNGATWDRLRTPVIFKTVNLNITAGTPLAAWTPAAGKKFRLMGFALSLSVAAVIKLEDQGAEILRVANIANGLNVSPPLGNGFLSAAANNVLQVDVGSSGLVSGFVFGTEE